MTDVRSGVYRHYKGPLYLVLGLAHDANADTLVQLDATNVNSARLDPVGGRTVVVYVPLQLDGAHLGPRMAVRTSEDFVRDVCWKLDCARRGLAVELKADHPCWRHNVSPRFTYLGPELTAEMQT